MAGYPWRYDDFTHAGRKDTMTVIREVSGHRGYRSHPREVIAEIRDNGQLDWSHIFVVEEGNDVTPPLSNSRLDSTIFFRQVYAFLERAVMTCGKFAGAVKT
jgi:hypothetical protein